MPVPSPVDPVYEAQGIFAKNLVENPPRTKEEAEAASLVAGAFAAIAAAEKTRDELRVASSRSARVQKWMQFMVGMIGLSGTLGGAFGTFYFMNELDREKKELARQEKDQKEELAAQKLKFTEDLSVKHQALVEKDNKLEKDRAAMSAIAMEREIAKRSADASDRSAAASDRLERAMRKEFALKEAELAKKQEELEITEKAAIESHKDRQIVVDKLRAEAETLKKESAVLSTELQDELRAKKPRDPQVAVILDAEKASRTAAPVTPPTSAAVNEYVQAVQGLFSPDSGVRGRTYTTLTGGKDRANPALLNALLQVGRDQMLVLKEMDVNSIDVATKAEVFRLRRGLENVVVTIRDMSRSVTKVPPTNREKVLAFADELIGLGFGAGEEAESLKQWLTNGTY